ncbi:isoleucyl-tRNA synthetase [Ascodesmis nigricans]|uniref:Isoleucine--tRNA ligase, mitochondrial n=1 Tax=Ascodesmis nigricans TaxID=341454 RepID=A0A4S2N4I9_9PEZI|nr:isoleucyl-tRNA synthetase [Ascodesmis nigricans]
MTASSSLRALQGSLKSSLLLPTTAFPSRRPPSAAAALLKKTTIELYNRQRSRPPTPAFTLHDGPPYANGELHMGHALNKILKDLVNRTEILSGNRVSYVPGWDCHGLPIELKALQNAKLKASQLSPLETRKLARDLATKTIEDQKAGFREWGVMGEWDNPYKTMDKSYEVRQLEVFKEMLKKGLIYRRFKPVYWSPSSGTALAEAELEYNENHLSKATFIKFPIVDAEWEGLSAVIWTTTPWTIPANKAIAVGKDMLYSVIESANHGKLLVANERLAYLEATGVLGDWSTIREDIPGSDLIGYHYTHPLLPETSPHPIFTADFVTADSGTGLVHMAPGHGMDDYLVCLKHDIQPFSPVNAYGKYTDELPIPSLHDLDAPTAGGAAVLELLEATNSVLHVNPKYKHKYPYDWRTKKPIMIRATAQWFADVSQIKAPAIESLEEVKFTPDVGRHRLSAFVKARSEWCISRQRVWGVPIPALYHKDTDDALLTEESVSYIINKISELGTDAWFDPSIPTTTFVPPSQADTANDWIRKSDTMDVWFDSGTSWKSLPSTPADLYLEGSDQARGWFQSSLLTSLSATSSAPFKHVLTHGFVLDKHGKKMSKSLGNVVAPSTFPSPETLRFWVAAADFSKDISLSPQAVATATESLRKARNTIRFLLGILSDFSPADTNAVEYDRLKKIDRIALHQLHHVATQVRTAYLSYSFGRAATMIAAYTSANLSAFYLDVIKDRVYSSAANSPERRAAQTVAWEIYKHYTNMLTPIVPMLVEEARQHAIESGLKLTDVETMEWMIPQAQWENGSLAQEWDMIRTLHDAVKRGFESLKKRGEVKVSLECQVEVVPLAGVRLGSVLEKWRDELEEAWIVSGVSVGEGVEAKEEDSEVAEEVKVEDEATGVNAMVVVRKARGKKCPRCWVYKAAMEGEVCGRCAKVLETLGV